ncbi:MAG: hypothetical protein IPQ08_00780 [Chitinophagaceae bacterium]|nr:hypothetical protein [Chitinophagaceae bacterium]
MKPTSVRAINVLTIIVAFVCMLGLVSWGQGFAAGRPDGQVSDTTPKNKQISEKKVRDLDDVIEEMDNADLKVDQEKIRRQIEESMKAFNGDQFKKQLEDAMRNMETSLKEINGDKIKLQMEEAMKNMEISLKEIDGDKIKRQIESSMKDLQQNLREFDSEKIRKEIEESLAQLKSKDLALEMDKMKKELAELSPKIEKEMEKAKGELEKAKTELKEYNEFISSLEKDGLLDRKKGYSVSYKEGELLIDGKKADDKTKNKYSEFLKKHEKFEISNKGEELKVEL